MRRFQWLISVAIGTSVLSFTSCITDSCACVTVPPTHTERWFALTPLRDSLDLTFTVTEGGGVANGTGVVTHADRTSQQLTVLGVFDGSALSPAQLQFEGWFSRPVTWVRTTSRSDSLYGTIFLPPGTRAGDTLGLSVYRRR